MDLEAEHRRLVDRLEAAESIRAAFTARPRHWFVPDVIWPEPTGLPVIRSRTPDAWGNAVYQDDAVTTQANDGGAGPVNTPSSSSSAPQVMADMIQAAGIAKGMRVLEVGTGTGWNAAVLAVLAGTEGQVTSVEVDPGIAEQARRALTGTGVRVVTGTLQDAPDTYDAVVVTCAMNRIPEEMAGYLARGAHVVVPWSPDPHSSSTPIAVLSAGQENSASLSGGFVREASFMRAREQRPQAGPFPGLGATPDAAATFEAGAGEVIDSGAMTPLMLMLPGLRLGVGMRPFDGLPQRIIYLGSSDDSWAYLWPDGTLTCGGPAPLGERLAAAYQAWVSAGLPPAAAFRLDADLRQQAYRVSAAGVGEWVHRADQAAP